MSDLNEWLKEHLLSLNLTNSMKQINGFTRLGFSKEEKRAHQQFKEIATNLGLKTEQDKVGNQWAIWEVDPSAPTIGMGSHLDTVIQGGGYDGVSGILCAFAAIRELKKRKIQPTKNIVVICFISEESARFGVSTIGSKIIAGNTDKNQWETIVDQNNVTIREAMEAYGINWDEIDEAYCEKDCFESFIELHIEQGNQLNSHSNDIGIVHGIATPVRLIVTANGDSNHTGTTMMDERKDALVAISPLISFVNKEAKHVNVTSKEPLVATISRLNIKPNVMNVIPGTVELGIDIRSVDDKLKRAFVKRIVEFCKEIEQESEVEIKIETIVDEDSVILDKSIQAKFVSICDQLEVSYRRMNSGAGHDVMNMAEQWPSGLIFIPSIGGISHNPKEKTPIRYLELGTQLLAMYLELEVGAFKHEY